jgi:hypothetical protein
VREEIKAVKADIDQVHETGEELAGLVGDVERVEVEKNIEDVDNMWDVLTDRWAQRQKALDDTLKKTTEFHDELMVSCCFYSSLRLLDTFLNGVVIQLKLSDSEDVNANEVAVIKLLVPTVF